MDLVHIVGIGVIAFYHINGGTNWNNNGISRIRVKGGILKYFGLTNLYNTSAMRQYPIVVVEDTSTLGKKWGYACDLFDHILETTKCGVWRIGHLIEYIHLAKRQRGHN